jgi:hypothetical protein
VVTVVRWESPEQRAKWLLARGILFAKTDVGEFIDLAIQSFDTFYKEDALRAYYLNAECRGQLRLF